MAGYSANPIAIVSRLRAGCRSSSQIAGRQGNILALGSAKKTLKEKIYTLDDVICTVDKPIQEKLSLMSDQEIAILIKGRGKQFCEKILSCVSAGRRKLIREEFEIMGAVSKRDCDTAAGEFLTWFRKARENGDIILYTDKDIFI
jgi:Flagellar motor switch protein